MKTVLITGVSRGIGKALAEIFLESSYFVIGTSTSGKANFLHLNLLNLELDISKKESVDACVQKITTHGKKIDILINNAGVASYTKDDSAIDIDGLKQTLEVNLIGTIDFTEKVLSLINNGGHIVNISSRYGSLSSITDAEYPDYRISKSALNMFTRILAIRLKDKITVSAVHPGWVKTDMGGEDADIEPKEAAEDLFDLATSKVESGNFWFKGKQIPW